MAKPLGARARHGPAYCARLGKGHIGNLNSSRGASSIGNVVRAAMTLFAMTEDDGEKYAIPAEERRLYVRLEDAKGNLHLIGGKPLWFKASAISSTPPATLANESATTLMLPR